MSTAARLVKLAEGLDANGVLSAAKGGTGGATGGGTASPTISAIGYGGDDTATNPAGGATVTLTGTNFASGARVLIGSTPVSVVTVVSATQITFTAPALAAGSYILYVVNLDGSTAIAVPGIQYSGTPAWTTAAGSLGTGYETAAVSTTVAATSDSTVTYSVVGGTLPDGVVINSSGTISGTSPIVLGSTTYTFTVRATDLELQDTDREFSLTINPDVVTWSTPTSIALQQDAASTTTLSASSAAGQTVSYAVDTLPAGLTLSDATVSGTPTAAGTTTTVATATAAVTGKTAQQTITWTVSIAADGYFPYTALLLNAETATAPFLSDASTNNFSLTAFGDARPSNFAPYTTGYYSVALDSQRHLSTPANSAFDFGSGDFTVEAWVYFKSYNSMQYSGHTIATNYENNNGWNFGFNGQNGIDALAINTYSGNNLATAVTATGVNSSVVPLNKWHHVAVTKSGSTVRMFLNGVGYTTSGTYTAVGAGGRFAIGVYQQNMTYSGNPNWNISNLRVVKGTAVYTTDFTPSITPLTAVTGTSLLACQGNRFVDASANAFPLTASSTSNISVSSFVPFQPNSNYSTLGSTYFDGSGDYLTAPSNAAFAFGTGDFTIEFWAYPTVNARQDWFDLTDGSSRLLLYYSGTNIIYYIAPSTAAVITGSAPVFNSWNHIALSRSSGSSKLFLNGVQIGSTYNSDSKNYTAMPLYLGKDGGGSTHITGHMSDVRIVKGTALYTANFTPTATPLTAVANTQLLTLQTNQPHTNSQFLDNSTSALTITRSGNATQGSFSPYGANWSNYFDGSSDAVRKAGTGVLTASGDVTIECWIYPLSTSVVGLFDGGRDEFEILRNYPANKICRQANEATGATFTVTANQWQHFACTFTSGNIKVYINGSLNASGTYSSTYNAGSNFDIGTINAGSAGSFNGYISNFRVTKSVLYTTTFTPSTAPLAPLTNTSLLTCQSNCFLDNSINNYTITKFGDTRVQRFSPFGTVVQTPTTHSVYFDGSGDYLTAPSNATFSLAGDFTIECWIYNSTVVSGEIHIYGKRSSSAVYSPLIFGLNVSSGANKMFMIGSLNGSSWGISGTTGSITLPLNQWNHIAVVRSGTSLKGYVNGAADPSLSFTASGAFFTNSDPITIGTSATTPPNYFTGYISNFRFVNGTAVYSTTFTPPTAPLAAITNTSLLTCQSATTVDNSTNAFTITAYGNATPRQQNPFGHTTSSAQDYTPNVFGNSAYFDGTGDYLSYTGSLSLTGAFTVQGWFYNTSTSGAQQTLFSFNSASGNGYGSLRADCDQANTQFNFSVNMSTNGSSWATTLSTNNAYIKNVWNHFAVTRDSSNAVKVFINGVQIASGTQAGTLYNTSTTNAIGCNNLPGTATNPFNGYISDLQLINGTALYTANFVPPSAPLTAVQNTTLLLNMDRAAVVDRSGKTVLETVGDAKISTAIKKYGSSSMYFDGTGDTLKIPANAQFQYTGDYTVEFWVYFNSVSTEVDIVGNYISNVGTDWMILKTANGTFQFYPSSANSYINGPTPVVNTWYHIAGVRSGSSLKLYVNGVSVGTPLTFSGTLGDATKPLYVGSRGGTTNFLNGYIDDLRISRYARYTANFTPPQQALLTK